MPEEGERQRAGGREDAELPGFLFQPYQWDKIYPLAVLAIKIEEDAQALFFPNKNNDGYIELTCRFFP